MSLPLVFRAGHLIKRVSKLPRGRLIRLEDSHPMGASFTAVLLRPARGMQTGVQYCKNMQNFEAIRLGAASLALLFC